MFDEGKEEKGNRNKELKLMKSLQGNAALFQEIFCHDDTIIFRSFEIGSLEKKCIVIYEDGMVDAERINENILGPMMNCNGEKFSKHPTLEQLVERVIQIDEVKKTGDIDMLVGAILYGDTVLLVDGVAEALIINTKGWQGRAVESPESEVIIKGPREGFVETLLVNISLIRRRVRSADLKFKLKELGIRTKTRICICYIEGLVNPKILAELENRINGIEIDGILGSNYIEEFIMDSPFSPFRTIGYTERPDVVVGNLLEGRIAVLCDGTPSVIVLPHLFLEYFQSSEDYYESYIYASINRLLRYLAFFLSTSVPAIYVALTTFHQEMIPTPLLLSISAAREGVPFPTIVEAILMLLAFEILREGGVRLPTPYGSTISFVGALILGQAAVEARLVSAPIVIVAALTGISNFLMPKLIGALIVVRTIFLLLSAFLGLYGYIFGVIGLFIHLMSMRSFGIPYMTEFSSFDPQDLKDTAIRAPWWYMRYRPKLIGRKNPARMKKYIPMEKR
ncbi:Spore germination protein B1 [Thermotalea metallivorans]|uniref:Spore germination protein B1 n=2 Tax=Thermotalea metallivorans TaxID=520762 RepID=A0A140L2G4_9FIRM|nr:Spore germination protein B1 [Thermotalea metallivorans]